jgi:hypothetical protein
MQTANLIAYLQMRQDPVTKDFPNSDADILSVVHSRIGKILEAHHRISEILGGDAA